MSQDNVQRVREGYERFNANKRLEADAVTPDFVVVAPDDLIVGGALEGPDAWVGTATEFTGTFDEFRADLEEVFDLSGDRVLAFVRFSGRGRSSGIPLELSLAHLWTFRGELAAKLRVYFNREEALEAVGLRATAPRPKSARTRT